MWKRLAWVLVAAAGWATPPQWTADESAAFAAGLNQIASCTRCGTAAIKASIQTPDGVDGLAEWSAQIKEASAKVEQISSEHKDDPAFALLMVGIDTERAAFELARTKRLLHLQGADQRRAVAAAEAAQDLAALKEKIGKLTTQTAFDHWGVDAP